jgi:hypothetical protein
MKLIKVSSELTGRVPGGIRTGYIDVVSSLSGATECSLHSDCSADN